jgi:hypothetical protein
MNYGKELWQIHQQEDSIKGLKEELLRKLGWVYSSDYPDCCWRWSKKFGSQTIFYDTDGAFAMEWHMSDYYPEDG